MKKSNRNGFRLFIAAMSLMLSKAVYMFFVGARSVALPTILRELNGSAYYGITIIISSMTMAVIQPLAGRLGDLIGRKRLYVMGLIGYAVSIVSCAIASNMAWLMISFAGCGCFFGFSMVHQMTLVVDVYDESQRPKMLSYISVASSVASLMGPVFGGLAVDYLSWRMIFWIIFPVAAVITVGAIISLPEIAPIQSDASVDYAGTVLFLAFVMPTLYTLTSAGVFFPWISVNTAMLLSVAAASLLLLIKCESKAENPVIPWKLFKNPVYVLCIAIATAKSLSSAAINCQPLLYQGVLGLSSTVSGVLTIPRQISTVICSLMIGRYISKTKNYRRGALLEIIVLSISMLMFANVRFGTLLIFICLGELLFGAATGISEVVHYSIGQTYLSAKEVGPGIAFITFIGVVGSSVGTAIIGCINNIFWNVESILPENLKSVLSYEQLQLLSNSDSLKDPSLIDGIKMSLPSHLYTDFDNSVLMLREGLNQGMRVSYIIFLIASVIVIPSIWKFKYPKTTVTR